MKLQKLNLGCGLDHRPGYVNIDAVAAVKPDVLHDVSEPLPYKNASVSEVIAQDILEHFIYDDFVKVVVEISRVLAVDGILKVRVPNIDAIIENFSEDKEVRNIFLYGSTAHRTDTGVFGAHKIGFTRQRLVAELLFQGLGLRKIRTVETNFEAEFYKLPVKETINKILFLNQALSLGGAETFDRDLFSKLQEKDISTHAYTTNVAFSRMLEKVGVTTSSIPLVIDVIGNYKGLIKAFFLFPFAWVYYGWIVFKERDADVVVMSGFPEKILASFWAKVFGLPVVWIEFGPLSPLFTKHFRLPKVLYRIAKQWVDRVIVPSKHTREDVLQSARVSLAKTAIVPCGSQQKKVAKFVDVVKPVVTCVSRLEPGKGQDLLIRALPEIIKKVPKVQLNIIGEGDFLSELTALVHELKLEKYVNFLGRVKNVRSHLEKAQVVVFPSIWSLEGFGLVTIEAMALAKPIVAFNRPPTNEILSAGETGLLAGTGDIADLAQNILSVLKSASLRKKIGTAALAEYTEKYQMDKVAAAYLDEMMKAKAWQLSRKVVQGYDA